MAIEDRIITPCKKRNSTVSRKASLRPAEFLPQKLNVALIGASGEPAATFDPRGVLTKLANGKSSQEYQIGESVFAQGDTAGSVFYVQSGKVKFTVVSKRGKEAVVAVLPQNSFFGEGCLAGRPLRMATASAEHRSTVIRVDKQEMLKLLHRDQNLPSVSSPTY